MLLLKGMVSFGHCRRGSKTLAEQQCRDGCWRSGELCCSGPIGHISVTSSKEVFAQPLESHMADQVPTLARDAASGKKKVVAFDFAVCSLIGSLDRMNGSKNGLHGGPQQLLLFDVFLAVVLDVCINMAFAAVCPTLL